MQTDYEKDWQPIETLEHAAIIIAGFVTQGRIGPLHEDDREAKVLLAHLDALVRDQEPK